MGRLLLLLIAGAALGGYTLASSSMDRRTGDRGVQSSTQARALARDAAETAHAIVVGDLIDPATDRFRNELTVPATFSAGGGQARVEGYSLTTDGQTQTATVTVAATVGQKAHRITSTYQLQLVDWPGPFVVESPYLVASTETGAQITANGPAGASARGIYVGTGRFDDYRLGSVLSPFAGNFATSMATTGASVYPKSATEMEAVYSEFGTPTIPELWAAAVSRTDETKAGGYRVSGTDRYGAFGNARLPDPQVLRVTGDLEVPYGAVLEGNGVLVVEGDVLVEGTLRWEGLVLVVPPSERQHVDVTLDGQEVEIRGSILVDQEAPPPGGHTDLTVFRALEADWSHPAGDLGPNRWSGPDRNDYHLQHTHRIDQPDPSGRGRTLGHRRFVFDAAGNEQETFTRFRDSVNRLVATHGARTDVVLEFANPDGHGAAWFDLRVDGDSIQGGVKNGFGDFADGSPYVTQAFELGDLESLVVDVRSLRMLEHLKNRNTSDSPFCDSTWRTAPFSARCLVENRVGALSHLRDRDGALTVRIALADGRPTVESALYEASLYWHTKSPGHAQHREEEAADNAWRASIQAGTANYGANLTLGSQTAVHLNLGHVQTAMTRLGLADLVVAHIGSRGESIEAGDVQ